MTESFAHSISIIIPTLNEEENIAPLVSEIAACAVPLREILFVDDHSIDETCEKVRALAGTHPIRLIEQDGAGPGLATAIMLGARAARGEILLVMDADLSHPPDRIKDLVAPLFCRHRRPCGRQPLCEGRVDARLASMAPGRVTGGGGTCASAYWPS
jgi:glycosyltransferase involved in cell wall biosynthesis